jgi:hypothetical protein
LLQRNAFPNFSTDPIELISTTRVDGFGAVSV